MICGATLFDLCNLKQASKSSYSKMPTHSLLLTPTTSQLLGIVPSVHLALRGPFAVQLSAGSQHCPLSVGAPYGLISTS